MNNISPETFYSSIAVILLSQLFLTDSISNRFTRGFTSIAAVIYLIRAMWVA